MVKEKLCFEVCLLQKSKKDEKVKGIFLPGTDILNISVRVYVFGLKNTIARVCINTSMSEC